MSLPAQNDPGAPTNMTQRIASLAFVDKATDEILNSKKSAFMEDEKVNIKRSVISEFGKMINKLRERRCRR
jgi:hypothetical protein